MLGKLANCWTRLTRTLDGEHGDKQWISLAQFLADHLLFLRSHGSLFLAYTRCGSGAITHGNIEAIMLAVNSVNMCSYCAGLHGEMARLAGVDDGLRHARSLAEIKAASKRSPHLLGVEYARVMAETDALGPQNAKAFEKLQHEVGARKAQHLRAFATFLFCELYLPTRPRLSVDASPGFSGP